MKKVLVVISSLFYLSFASIAFAADPTPITITRIEDTNYFDPNWYRFEMYFTPKIDTFLPEGGYFSGCGFNYNPNDVYTMFPQAAWSNDASETESKCVFMVERPAGANIVSNYTGKLHIGGGLSNIYTYPVGLSEDYTFSVPGKPVAPQFNVNLQEEDTFFGEEYAREFSFTDSDSTLWTASINYGDGNSEQFSLNDTNFILHHTYQQPGRYILTITITDNHEMSRMASGYVNANYHRYIGGPLTTPSAILSSAGFSNTENIFVKDDGNVMNKVADSASITFSLDNFSSEYNIHTVHVTPYFEAAEAPDGLTCHATIITDKGEFTVDQPFPNPNCGYGNGGGGDNAHFGFTLPNDVHNVYSLTYTISSPEGSYFPLTIDYVETQWGGSIYDRPVVDTGGPYEVIKGENIVLQGSVSGMDDVPSSTPIDYNWDFDNDGTYDNYGLNPTFSTENLEPGTYTVTFQANKWVQYTNLFSFPESTTITVLENTAPVISNAQASPSQVNTNTSVTLSADFTDANDSDTHTALIDWGDGNTSEGVVTEASGSGNVTGEHAYTSSGNYVVTVTITDNHDASDSQIASVEVINNEPVTLYPTADSYIKQGSSNENEGASSFMRLQSTGHNRSLVKFDQSQIQTAVNGAQNYTAKLQFTISDNGNNWGSTGRPIALHRLTQDWTEGNGFIDGNNPSFRGTGNGITWSCSTDANIQNTSKNCTGNDEWNMTNSSLWPFSSAATATTTITNNQTGVVEFDVTSDVQSFVNGANTNTGWLLKKENEGQNGRVEFGTKESSNTPVLVITFD